MREQMRIQSTDGYMTNVFDYVRLIDADKQKIVYSACLNDAFSPAEFLDFPANQHVENQSIYMRSLSEDRAMFQFHHVKQKLFLCVYTHVEYQGVRLIGEYSVEITDRFYQANPWHHKHESLVPYTLLFLDELTNIYNRRYINKMLPAILGDSIRKRLPFSLIFTDIDNFKQINDQYGHLVGDRMLRAFARELQHHIDEQRAWVARYGGDEFLISMQNTEQYEAKRIAEAIRRAVMQQEFWHEDHKIMMTCSLGVYTVEDFTKSLTCDMLLTIIDEKLYQAKHAGKNVVRW